MARQYGRAKASNLVKVTIKEDVTPRLRAMGKSLRSPEIVREMQRGAQILVVAAQRRVPVVRTGALQRGIYSTSQLQDNRPTISRRGTNNIVQGPKRPPAYGQVLVISGTFYARWVEKGRSPRAGAPYGPLPAGAKRQRAVGLQGGRKRGRPFFKPAIKAAKPTAEAFIVRRIERLLAAAFESGQAR